MHNYRKFVQGLAIPSKTLTESDTTGELEVLISNGKLNYYNGLQATQNSPIVTEAHSATLTNKTVAQGILLTCTADTITGIVGGAFVLQSAANEDLSLQAQGTGDVLLESLTINANTITGGAANLTIQSASNQNLNLSSQGSGAVNITTAANTDINLLPNGTGIINLGTSIDVDGDTAVITAANDLNFFINSQGTGNIYLNASGTGGLAFYAANTFIANVTSGGMGIVNGLPLILFDSDNSQAITIKSPAVVPASYAITLPSAAPGANTALVYNGSDFVWSTAGGWNMNSDLTLTASDTIAISTTAGQQVWEVQGNSAAITLSTTPFGSTDPVNGAVIRLIGRSNTNTVTILNNDAANGCILNGDAVIGYGDFLEVQYLSSIDRYVETGRNF